MAETQVVTRTVIENYINRKAQLTTELTEIYRTPANVKAAAVILCHAATIDSLNDGTITIGWSDYSDNDFVTYLLTDGNVPARAGLSILDGKLLLEPQDAVYAKAGELNRLHLTLSIIEIS